MASTATRYTIDTPPIDPDLLQSTVYKNLANFDRYLDCRPVAAHTREAFAQLQAELAATTTTRGLILDSGCGTGRSSLILGERFPDKMIVGVDRSIDRLGRVARDLTSGGDTQDINQDDRQHVQRVGDNVILVRAELVHFWRLWRQDGLLAEQHYLLYPNPYPKKSRLKQRWYAHASFPLLLLVSGGNPLVLRSNWELYLQEFVQAVEYASACQEDKCGHDAKLASKLAGQYLGSARNGPTQRLPGDAWTNFEAKYDKIGESTYELLLQADVE